ncbi:D-sedoheptulose 7-phosphate isomerase [Sodalis-like secondary symbiont of Drepanosiphum platanoidis]|uniref:D-sedoheptulose 7-phosphate isomerase n=1 Tax=Sodalis-like secondary symbiont of Drepanosiphum platanoidis TaxID=2994493 RepID=UPI003463CFE5
MYQKIILRELKESEKLLKICIKNKLLLKLINKSAILISNAFKIGGKIFSCGNGGSHCDAMHFSEELMGRYRNNRPGYPALVISDPSYLSCVSNDFGYKYIFSRYVETIGKKKDILFVISTSGNSENIIEVIKSAHIKKMKIIALTGKDGGKISNNVHIEIRIPYIGYADRIQEIHLKIIHILVFLIEKEMNKKFIK